MNFALLLVAIALGAPSREEVLRQQVQVEQAAAAVAQARAEGARRRDVAQLMALYREQAEILAGMQVEPGHDATAEAHRAAVTALAEATARGRADPDARAVLDEWLGGLASRLDLLDGAVEAAGAVRSPDLARSMLLDVEAQCVAVMLAAAHDATAAEREAEAARVRAAALEREGSGQGGGVGTMVDIRALLEQARQARDRATTAWLLRDRAEQTRDRVRDLLEAG